jgi:hypothetical protein
MLSHNKLIAGALALAAGASGAAVVAAVSVGDSHSKPATITTPASDAHLNAAQPRRASHRPPAGRTSTALAPAIAASIAAFKQPLAAGEGAVEEQNALAIQYERAASSARGAEANLPMVNADFGLARPSPLRGSNLSAWIAPSGSLVCSYLPAPMGQPGSYGATCATVEQIKAGQAIQAAAHSGEPGPVAVAVVVADGATPPTVIEPNGHESAMTVTGNVAAAVLPSTDSLRTANGTLDLSSFTN